MGTQTAQPASASPGPARSPCIGVCTTTYGDLTCRGCRRYSHEVVGWNSYDERQKWQVLDRIRDIMVGSVQSCLAARRVRDILEASAEVRYRPRRPQAREVDAYEVMRRLVLRRKPPPWWPPGVAVAEGAGILKSLLRAVEQEALRRSRAIYGRSFQAAESPSGEAQSAS